MGFLKKLHSDREANFLSNKIMELCEIHKIKNNNTHYHIMFNVIEDIFNRTIKNFLRILTVTRIINSPTIYNNSLIYIYIYNSTQHSST